MKAYNKSEVDIIFSGWKEDLKQLSEIEVVSIDVLEQIRDEIEHEGAMFPDGEFFVSIDRINEIIDKYKGV